MKILNKDLRHGSIKIKIDSPEDRWYLENIIEPEDIVGSTAERKIKLGGSEEKSKIIIRTAYIKIRVEKIESKGDMRIAGVIVEAPDDIPKGEHQSFSVNDGATISIEKDSWSRYHLKKIDDACKPSGGTILLVAFDREEALFAILRSTGYELLQGLKGDVQKKDFEEKKGNFYSEIAKEIKSLDTKNSFSSIIIASPAFWKEYLIKEIDESIRKKSILATCSSIDERTINEILKRPELRSVLEKDRSAREIIAVDNLLDAIRKDEAAYGLKNVDDKVSAGNALKLLISENLIRKLREEKKYSAIDNIMNAAEDSGAEIIIISTDDSAKKLDGISGIGAIQRWKDYK